jgi:putative transposase
MCASVTKYVLHEITGTQFGEEVGVRLSRLHARMANIRQDAAHKLTTGLTRRFETIVIEDLNVSGMAKNRSLAGAVLDCGFHEIRRQLEYKAAMGGGRIVIADRFYPSTQICSCCGSITGPKGREGLGVEQWCCGQCGADHKRDANAAIVLRKLGLAKTELTRGDNPPLSTCAGMPTSIVAEP